MRTPDSADRALVILLPKRIWGEVNRWRQAYDPNYSIFPPHITVVYPAFIPAEQWSSLRLAVRQCLAQFRPFQIGLDGLGTFEDKHYVLWLRVDDGGQLSRIRDSLMHCLPQHVPPSAFAYVPHVTIGAFESQAELHTANEALRTLKPRRFTVRHLTYLFPDAHGVWSIYSHVALGIGHEK